MHSSSSAALMEFSKAKYPGCFYMFILPSDLFWRSYDAKMLERKFLLFREVCASVTALSFQQMLHQGKKTQPSDAQVGRNRRCLHPTSAWGSVHPPGIWGEGHSPHGWGILPMDGGEEHEEKNFPPEKQLFKHLLPTLGCTSHPSHHC